jgi:Membrane bound beta barrel domain (DUF5777)
MNQSRLKRNFKPLLASILLLLAIHLTAAAQDDLMNLLEEESDKDKKPDYATASFKTTRVINGHSIENVSKGVLDFRISHRFGFVNSGAYELWGLDQASMRMGLDYGITNWLMVGVGRSSYQKQYDGLIKAKILRQSSGSRKMPITVSATGSIMYKSIAFDDPTRVNYTSSNLFYSGQVLIGRKFSEGFSFQLAPTLIHYNLVPEAQDSNDIFALGAGGRLKLTKRVSINAEYYWQLPSQQFADTHNSLAIGFDIETGGHVFQLNFTNSTGMTERTFISETTGNFFKGDIHFGFTISRVFTIVKPKEFKKG